MTTNKHSTPRRESATVDASLRAEAAGPETDTCGYCGGPYLVTPFTLEGVCPPHASMVVTDPSD